METTTIQQEQTDENNATEAYRLLCEAFAYNESDKVTITYADRHTAHVDVLAGIYTLGDIRRIMTIRDLTQPTFFSFSVGDDGFRTLLRMGFDL